MSQKGFYIFLFIMLVLFLYADTAWAQCPMCKASAESSLQGGSTQAKGLNKGILYLLMTPYLLFASIFLLWYNNYRKKVVVKEV